jgi:ubiquinone biosynthesis protein
MARASISQWSRNFARFGQVVAILAKYGLADWVSHVDPDLTARVLQGKVRPFHDLTISSRETRIRLVITELGTTFIKLGQILSTRADLVGPVLAEELSLLQSQAPPDPPEVVLETLEVELGQPVSETFAAFDPVPIASASIGQVHRATLPDGRAVVVKIQHPGIESRIRNDLEILQKLAELAEKHPEFKPYRPSAITAEFSRTLLRELEFGREARNLQQFRRNFAGDSSVRFPEPLPDLSTNRVLTMEWIDGTSIRDADALEAAGFDLDQVARRGATVFLEMIFRDGFYHADPHPGNLVVMADGRIGMLDCGMVGRIDDLMRETIEELILAIADRDAMALTNVIIRLCNAPQSLDRPSLANDVTDFLSYYGGQSLRQFDLGGAFSELIDLIRRYKLFLPSRVSLLLKVLVTLEGTARKLSPRFNLIELLEGYQRKIIWRHLNPKQTLRKLRRIYVEWNHLGETLPGAITDVVEQMQAGRFDVHLEHRRLEPSVNRLVLGLMASALFVGSSLLWSRGTPPTLYGVSVFGSLGALASVILGFRLLWAIHKSGRLETKS